MTSSCCLRRKQVGPVERKLDQGRLLQFVSDFNLNSLNNQTDLSSQKFGLFLSSISSYQELFKNPISNTGKRLEVDHYTNKYLDVAKNIKVRSPKIRKTKLIALKKLNSVFLKLFLNKCLEIDDFNLQIIELHLLAEVLIRKNRNSSSDK